MKLKGMTAEEIIAQFPPLDEPMRRELEKKYMPSRLFLFDRNDLTRAWCSNCGEEMALPRPIRRSAKYIDHCPRCGEIVRSGRIWARDGVRDRVLVLRYESIESEEGLLGARLFYLDRDWRGLTLHPWDAYTEAAVDSFYLFRYGEGGVEVAPERGRTLNFNWREKPVRYSVRRSVSYARYGAYITMGGRRTTENYIDCDSIARAVSGTPFRYIWAAVEKDFPRRSEGIKLFDYAAKYPFATECLAKMGKMSRIMMIDITENGRSSHNAVNWHGETLREVFKASLSKADKAYMLQRESSISFAHALSVWQERQKQGIFLPLEDFIELGLYETAIMKEIGALVDFRRLAKYLKKQDVAFGREVHIDVRLYRDYLRECVQLDMDMQQKSVLFPKNLLRRHENLTRQIRFRESEEDRKKFAARRPLWEAQYTYKEETYSIVLPKMPQDLIDEGKALNHCVGTYIKRVADGKTDILFIRPTKDTRAHLATMEVKNGHIVQARTKNNGNLPKDVEAFVERFRRAVLQQEGRSRSA